MADTTPDSSEQPDNAGAPTEAPTGTTQSTDLQPPTQPETGADEGKGSKDAVLADLARERDKRQNLEAQFNGFKDAFAKALGLGGEKPLTTEELTAKVTEQTKRADTLERQLALERSLPATVDKDALLDSTTFQKALDGVPADKVAETVAFFVDQHPRFLRTNPGAGASDAGAGNPPTPAKSMDDWIRGK